MLTNSLTECHECLTPFYLSYQRAIALALKLDHHLCDTLYHAVALEEKAMLITADRKYYDKAGRMGSILMLEEFDG